jgi:hypothetical protein
VILETIRRVQLGDYSHSIILFVFASGAALVAYYIIKREGQENGL